MKMLPWCRELFGLNQVAFPHCSVEQDVRMCFGNTIMKLRLDYITL